MNSRRRDALCALCRSSHLYHVLGRTRLVLSKGQTSHRCGKMPDTNCFRGEGRFMVSIHRTRGTFWGRANTTVRAQKSKGPDPVYFSRILEYSQWPTSSRSPYYPIMPHLESINQLVYRLDCNLPVLISPWSASADCLFYRRLLGFPSLGMQR